jgi:hypothetical protein
VAFHDAAWGWLTVSEAQRLPLPDTSWMDEPWPREKYGVDGVSPPIKFLWGVELKRARRNGWCRDFLRASWSASAGCAENRGAG